MRESRSGRIEHRCHRRQQDRGQRQPRSQPRLRTPGPRSDRGRPPDRRRRRRAFGDRRGDELPPELATSAGRQQWFKGARRWLDDQRAEQAAPMPRDRSKRVKEAKRRMDEQLFTELRAEQAYQRYRARGKDRRGGRLGPNTVPKPYVAPEMPPGEINTTDLDSRMVKGQHQFLQGYNAQAAINEQQIVIAAEIEVVSPDFGASRTHPRRRPPRAPTGRDQRAPKGSPRRLRLLAHRTDATPRRRRHPGPHPPRSGLRTTPRPGWTAASMTSCDASWPPSTARRSTDNAST